MPSKKVPLSSQKHPKDIQRLLVAWCFTILVVEVQRFELLTPTSSARQPGRSDRKSKRFLGGIPFRVTKTGGFVVTGFFLFLETVDIFLFFLFRYFDLFLKFWFTCCVVVCCA